MSPARATMKRTIGFVTRLYSTAFAVMGFFAVSAALVAFGLWRADGGMMPLSAVIAAAMVPVLPFLAALVTMDVWSDERSSGRIDVLLSTSVRERDLTLGKFFGAWLVTVVTCAAFMATSLALLYWFVPTAVAGVRFASMLLALAGLGMQSALWCAVTVAVSALFRHSAAAAAVSVMLTTVLPRGLWLAVMELSGEYRLELGDMPFDAQAVDFASGMISSGTVVTYIALTVLALFISSKAVASLRFAGVGARGLRASTGVVTVLAVITAVLASALALRINVDIDLPIAAKHAELSSRTRSILSDSDGEIAVTGFLSRKDARFRQLAQQLRQFRREATQVGGARLNLRFVDPNWDLAAAERLISRGATANSIVLERGYRLVTMPLADGWSERQLATSIRRLSSRSRRQNVYWTTGHGETAFDDYGTFGMSDIARDMVRDGYRNDRIDLAGGAAIPGDCALVVIAGARRDFSRAELDRLEAYLGEGGRLLVLVGTEIPAGVKTLLMAWGMRPNGAAVAASSAGGQGVVVSEFGNHAISHSLRGSRIILGNPMVFSPAVAAEVGTRLDRSEFSAIASAEGECLAAAVERGAKVGSDLAIRPTRIVAVGDVGFAVNGELKFRANSNRDFFLNCIAYLSGVETTAADGNDAAMLTVGMEGRNRIVYLAVSVLAVPLVMFVLICLHIVRRRRCR